MNFPNDSSERDNEINSSSDEDEDMENIFPHSSSLLVERYLSTNPKTFDISDDDDDDNDIENHSLPSHSYYRQNRLSTILRQSNHLVELKFNLLHHHHHHQPSLRLAISNSHLSKESTAQLIYSTRLRRLYLPSSSIVELQTDITNWLQASTCLIDSISTSTYHRRCWSQLLLTYFIERRFINLQFLLCTDSLTLNSTDQNSCSFHQYACIPEEDASKLCSILQKGSRFNIDSNIFDHLRRIIVIKSMQETLNENPNIQQLYVKQLTSLKQSLTNMNKNNNLTMSVASIYSKVLLFLSSLYSIKAETMQTLFCQHLLHNPMYSYLITS